MIVTSLAIATITIGAVCVIEAIDAMRSRRPAEPLVVVAAGIIGILFFMALYAAGMMF